MRMPARVKHFSYNDSMQRKRKTQQTKKENMTKVKAKNRTLMIKHYFFKRYFYRFVSTKDFANVFTPVSPLGRKPKFLSFVVKKQFKLFLLSFNYKSIVKVKCTTLGECYELESNTRQFFTGCRLTFGSDMYYV